MNLEIMFCHFFHHHRRRRRRRRRRRHRHRGVAYLLNVKRDSGRRGI